MKIEEKEEIMLLAEMAKGSTEAFAQFYDKYHRFIFYIALKMLANHSEAEDLCHDVFLEIYRNPKSYNEKRGSVEAWLAVKTKSRCLDRLRQKKYKLVYDEESIEKLPSHTIVEQEVIAAMEHKTLMDALVKLPKSQQYAIYENYFREVSQREISALTNTPLGTVKSQIRYGLKKLKKILGQQTAYDAVKGRGKK